MKQQQPKIITSDQATGICNRARFPLTGDFTEDQANAIVEAIFLALDKTGLIFLTSAPEDIARNLAEKGSKIND